MGWIHKWICNTINSIFEIWNKNNGKILLLIVLKVRFSWPLNVRSLQMGNWNCPDFEGTISKQNVLRAVTPGYRIYQILLLLFNINSMFKTVHTLLRGLVRKFNLRVPLLSKILPYRWSYKVKSQNLRVSGTRGTRSI